VDEGGDQLAALVGRGAVEHEQAMAVLARGRAQRAQHPALRVAEREVLLGRVGAVRHHDHDVELRAVALHALDQRLVHGARGEVLRLDVDQVLRGRDRVLVQELDLLGLHRLRALVLAEGQADADLAALDRHRALELRRLAGRQLGKLQPIARHALPAHAEQPGQVGDHRAGAVRHQVVVRLLRRVLERDPVRVLERVQPVVPARVAQVDPAGERDRVVRDHELLMVARAGGVLVVEHEVDALVRTPVELQPLHPLALEREHQAVVPGVQVELQLRPRGGGVLDQLEQAHRRAHARRVLAAHERDEAVELPAGDQHVALRAQHGLVDRQVIVAGVDQHAAGADLGDVLAVAARFENRLHGLSFSATSRSTTIGK
jgi:hypothetical protein